MIDPVTPAAGSSLTISSPDLPNVSPVSLDAGAHPTFLNPAAPAERAASPETFSAMIGQMIGDTADTVKKAEATSISAVHGNASIQDVVESVMAAEQSLRAAIAVRDKVTAAYLELSRMGI